MKLVGISKKGRERLKRDGDSGWTIQRTEDTIAFSPDRGPWILIIPPCMSEPKSRWIHQFNDKNFKIVDDDPAA